MDPNPYAAYHLAQAYVTDAVRDAEKRRLARAVQKHTPSSNWVQQLTGRLQQLVHPRLTQRESKSQAQPPISTVKL
jgi:hypothetical protein